MLVGDGREPVVLEVDDDSVRPPAAPFPGLLPAGRGEETGERRGEAIEGDLEQLDLLRRDIGRSFRAVPEAVDGRQWQGHEADVRGELRRDGPGPGDVPRGGEEGDDVAAPRQLLGELEEGDDVAEGEPWEHHHVKSIFFIHIYLSVHASDGGFSPWPVFIFSIRQAYELRL
ncbi:hypothetical protein SEVIR_2G078650v4 [Setaria viridis]